MLFARADLIAALEIVAHRAALGTEDVDELDQGHRRSLPCPCLRALADAAELAEVFARVVHWGSAPAAAVRLPPHIAAEAVKQNEAKAQPCRAKRR